MLSVRRSAQPRKLFDEKSHACDVVVVCVPVDDYQWHPMERETGVSRPSMVFAHDPLHGRENV